MKLKKSLILLINFLLPLFILAQEYTIKNYGQKEGLNFTSFLTVEEADDGYLWFGTDGAGLMRYDGREFDYLETVQGRNSRHVNQLSFDKDRIIFSTLYRGFFEFKDNQFSRLNFNSANQGDGKAVFLLPENYLVVKNSEISIYKDTSLLIDMKGLFPKDAPLIIYNKQYINDWLVLFTSKGSFIINDKKIQNLHDWLLTDKIKVSDIVTSMKTKEGLLLVDKYLKSETTVLLDGSRPKFFVSQDIDIDILEEDEYVIKVTNKENEYFFLTNKGGVIHRELSGSFYRYIIPNTKSIIGNPTDILVDYNGDIWVTTYTEGIYRISKEPFTKIGIDPLYRSPNIVFYASISDKQQIFSVYKGGTYIAKSFEKPQKISDKYVSSIVEYKGAYLVSTNDGVYQIEGNQLKVYEPLRHLKGKSISLVYEAFGYLWYGIWNDGLYRMDIKTGEEVSLTSTAQNFLNCLINKDSTSLYFGTNNGLYHYYKEEELLSKKTSIVDTLNLGSYVGNSTIDSYGNLWFSYNEGLMGVLKSGKVTAIHKEEHLPSLLIYTLNADNFGNLYVGSNKGITVIKVEEGGSPVSSNTYDWSNGFYGYETNMRVSNQERDGSIIVGTVEGLFKIKPWKLMKLNKPRKPIIYSVKNKNIELFADKDGVIKINSGESSILINFKTVNSKSNFIYYSYRIKGHKNEWSEWSKDEYVVLDNLTSGEYDFEVRASLNRRAISDVATLKISVHLPFYKNKWFIISTIGLIVMGYIFFVDRSRSFDKRNIILSRDVGASRSMGKGMLLFGCIANTTIHLLAPRIEPTIENHDISAIVIGIIVLVLYLFLMINKKHRRSSHIYLGIGFLLLLGYNTLYTFLSGIHPFYLTNILLIVFLTSYAFRRLRSAIFLSVALLAVSTLTIFFVDNAFYNQYLFLITIALASFIMIFMMYLRNTSLEHLIFTSGVINNGNALVVAFDLDGKISYASENIEILLGIKEELKGKPISYLNRYYPPQEKIINPSMQNVDLASTFKEGAIFVTPLITAKNELVYYQWSCKEFSSDVRVVLGQDVTDKINLENYYELIVKNAEDVIFQTDSEGNFSFINEKGLEVLERTREDLLSSNIYDLASKSSLEELKDFFKTTLESEERDGYLEFLLETPSGKTKWLGLKLTTMRSPGIEDEVLGFLGLARDVTEALKHKKIIEEQNKDITDSINYARRIQFNMLPKLSSFKENFENFFILYKPRDIVSGDFFWLKKIENKTILIVSDCTGHGVPGSFLTSLGINLLNQIVVEGRVTNPGDILNLLDERLIDMLPRDGRNKITDGMETTVCVFDDNSDLLEYATAGGRFIIVNNFNETVSVVRGQTKHIGDDASDDYSYLTEMITVTEDQTLYMFSDGYPDQFGGAKDKKLNFKRFQQLIKSVSNQELKEQNLILQEHLSEWIGERAQTDDITIIGIRGIKK